MQTTLTERVSARYPSHEGFRVTETLVYEIVRELGGTRANPVKIGSRYGVPASMVRYIMQEIPAPNTEFGKHSEDGWGKENLRAFLIARKIAGDAWSEDDEDKINVAREAYDDGLVEMCQGRDGDFILQYSIPRKKKAKRTYTYFAEMTLEFSDDQ